MFGFFLCRRVDLCDPLDLEISQSIGLAGENLKTISLTTAPLAYDFFRFVRVPQEEKPEERIAWLKRGIERFDKAILEVKDLIQNRWKNATWAALAQKYSEKLRREESIVRPRDSGRGRGREHERTRDVGPSR